MISFITPAQEVSLSHHALSESMMAYLPHWIYHLQQPQSHPAFCHSGIFFAFFGHFSTLFILVFIPFLLCFMHLFLCFSHLTYGQSLYLNLILTILSFQTTSFSFSSIFQFFESHLCVTNVTPTRVQTCREGRNEMMSPAGRLTTCLLHVGRTSDWHRCETKGGTKSEVSSKGRGQGGRNPFGVLEGQRSRRTKVRGGCAERTWHKMKSRKAQELSGQE